MVLQAIEKMRAALAWRPEELASARASGRKVIGWTGYNVPEELIYACGMIPVRISRGGSSRLAEMGANYISTQNCFFLRQCVGPFAEDVDPYIKQIDALVTDTTCLQSHRMSSLVEHYFQVNLLQLGMPKDPQRPEARRYFAHEVRFLVARLEKIAGRELDTARLAETLELYQNIREAVRELYRRVWTTSTLSWRTVNEMVHAGYLLDRVVYLGLLQELLQESKEDPGEKLPSQSVRVLLAGSPMAPGDNKLIEIVEKSGAVIAGDLLWSGFAQFTDLDFKECSLQGLIDSYLDRLPHAALPFMEVVTDRKLIKLLDVVRQSGARGVIYYSLRFCDPFSFKMLVTKDYLKLAGVPLMEAQTDFGEMDIETLRTRVEAFLEMLAIRS
jgi:benzoyl-CoA reductase/2-hydroxyglutaryl-CoA dehydratase subunit BcrC/BadD/HgdB